jgi:hypothetical protein
VDLLGYGTEQSEERHRWSALLVVPLDEPQRHHLMHRARLAQGVAHATVFANVFERRVAI